MDNVLIFGSSGTLGSECAKYFAEKKWNVLTSDRNVKDVDSYKNLNAVVWAQGSNLTASLQQMEKAQWVEIWEANFFFVVKTLKTLLDNNSLAANARLVVFSSVWEEVARKDKSAYISSKAAIGGFIRSMASELGDKNISINGVLPGIIDSPMTRKNLSSAQVNQIIDQTPGNKLVKPEEIATIAEFLASKNSQGINGQSITVDNAWTISRNV
jgi:NAD(P)-dependent dehydrogenase (short-subunit alcohol dehydrogenase family)